MYFFGDSDFGKFIAVPIELLIIKSAYLLGDTDSGKLTAWDFAWGGFTWD